VAIWGAWGISMVGAVLRRRAIDMPLPRGATRIQGVIEEAEAVESEGGKSCAAYAVALSVGSNRPFVFAGETGALTVRTNDGTRVHVPAGAVRMRSRRPGVRFNGKELWTTLAPQLEKLDHNASERLLQVGDQVTLHGTFERQLDRAPSEDSHGTAYRDGAASLLVATGPVAIDA
jgi:hypothetical protein